jgi:ADP-ribose pyrophosphatase
MFLHFSVRVPMSLSKWKKLSEKELYKNPWWVYRQDTFRLPNGEVGEYFYVHTNGSSMVVPVLDDGRIVMVKQYRYLCDEESLEFPSGGVKGGSDYPRTAAEELAQEAGYSAAEWQLAGRFNPYNGITNEICRVYIARGLKKAEQQPDPTEEFEQFHLTAVEIEAKINSGEIWDGMTIAAWMLARPSFKYKQSPK